MSSRWMSPVKMMAKQVLFDFKILSIPADGIPKVLKGENIELVRVNVDDDSCGMYCIEDDKRKICINSHMDQGRENFTIAHELGHHFLSHQLNKYCRIYRNLNTAHHNEDPQEVEANYFAACFLMPYELVMSMFNVIVSTCGCHMDTALNISIDKQLLITKEVLAAIASDMKVSKEAALYRLKSLKLLKYNNFDEVKYRLGYERIH